MGENKLVIWCRVGTFAPLYPQDTLINLDTCLGNVSMKFDFFAPIQNTNLNFGAFKMKCQ